MRANIGNPKSWAEVLLPETGGGLGDLWDIMLYEPKWVPGFVLDQIVEETYDLHHGSYSRRNFWISPKQIGLAPHLARAGFDRWVPELRGHGGAPKTDRYRAWTAEDHIRIDLPAIAAHVFASTGAQELAWVGHSAGGLFISAALSAGYLDEERARALVLGGSQIELGDGYLHLPGVGLLLKALLRLMGSFDARRFGLGPEEEPAGEMIEYIDWKYRGTRWTNRAGFDYLQGLARLSLPLLSLGAAADRNDPPAGCESFMNHFAGSDRTFVLLSEATGYSRDYGHADIFASRDAAREVWPLVERWLRPRC